MLLPARFYWLEVQQTPVRIPVSPYPRTLSFRSCGPMGVDVCGAEEVPDRALAVFCECPRIELVLSWSSLVWSVWCLGGREGREERSDGSGRVSGR